MTEDERFDYLDEVYLKIDDEGADTEPARYFHRGYELLGDPCLTIWTGYEPQETQGFIQAVHELGFAEAAQILRKIDSWLSQIGFDGGDPELSPSQQREVDAFFMEFDKLTKDREARMLFDYVQKHRLGS